MSIYNTAVNKPISTLMVFLAIIVLGVASYIQLPVDQYPKMDPPYITVMATYPGANAADIEENVTKILEDQLNSVDDLKELTSTSYDNLSVISLEFEWEVNLDEASNDVRDAVDKAMSRLPDDIDRPTIMRFNTSMMPILIYAVTAKESYPGIDKILDDKLITRLNRVDGVASVIVAGAPERVVYVDLDPNKLDAYNLTLEQIGSKILAENKDVSSGNVKMGQMDYTLRVEGEFEESDQIKNIVLGTQNDKIIYLRDVANVRDTLKDITLEQTINRGRGGVLMVTKQTDANAVAVAKQAKGEIEKAQKELPTDIKFQIISDNSDFIIKSINNLQESLMYALIFVILIVFLFLGRWRATFIIALTIPISLIVAFIYLFATGESLNIISLSSLSIAIGMVVDDAIVVLENITKHIDRGSRPREAAKYGTNEVWLSVIVTTLVTVAVFFPLTLVTGMTGILFKQLGWNSLLPCVALFVIVALLPLLFNRGLEIAPKDTHERAKKADVFYFFTQKNIWKQIGFLFLYYSGLIGTLAMLKPYLVDLGYSMKEIGVMSGVIGTSFGFIFSFVGGFIVRRIGRHWARILFAVLVLLATLYFLGLSYVTPTLGLLHAGIALLWGSYGMATIVVYTTAMDCVRPGREGTDFTIQTVITHLSGMVMAILSGKIADHTGYHGLFFFEVSLAALSLVYILIVFRKEKETV